MDIVTLRLMNAVIAIFSDQFKLLPVGAAVYKLLRAQQTVTINISST